MKKTPYPSETQERFIVRMPDGMRDKITETAKANNRSMNAEIVARLEQSFDPNANLLDLNWLELVEALQQIAKEKGVSISIIVGADINK